jgi:glycogen(starch) synthase
MYYMKYHRKHVVGVYVPSAEALASDVGEHREVIGRDETGILFKAGNADALSNIVLQLLKHQDRWPVLRANGRYFVESERNWASRTARCDEAYRSIVRGWNE